MPQKPLFIFGEDYGAFYGPVDQNALHQNAAYQVVLGQESDITILGEDNVELVGNTVLIKSLTAHRIKCDGLISLIYFSPGSNFVLSHLKHLATPAISLLSPDVLPFPANASFGEIIDTLNEVMNNPKSTLDPRLAQALADLEENLQSGSIAEAAEHCGLSRSRLRTLAREQLGIPLSTWFIWKKLIQANKSLSLGASLSEAALMGGFSDQAHFTRSMKRMFGVTPAYAVRVLC